MKNFVVNITIVCFISALGLSGISIWDATKLQRISYKLSEDKHIIVMGPSTTGCALIDSCIPGFKNLSKDGMSYYSYKLLPNILECNNEIDTVLINWGRFWLVNRNPINEDNTSVEHYRALLPYLILNYNNINWRTYISNVNFCKILLNVNLHRLLFDTEKNYIECGFGYKKLTHSYLHCNDKKNSVYWYDKNTLPQTTDWVKKYASISKKYVLGCINECHKKGRTPVLIFTPLYKYEKWCSKKMLIDIFKEDDPNILIADYEDFEFPDDTYYADVHHLNYKGANYFSNYIAEHGLEYVTLQEWIEKVNEKIYE